MPEAVFHQMLMLRPMQAGISGFARLQGEAGRQLVQINLRGLSGGGMRAFWYAGDGLVRELGCSEANSRGEAGLYTELYAEGVTPGRLTALLLLSTGSKPRPLAIGLCTAQSAGSLLDAKSALLALCERLSREAEADNGSVAVGSMPADAEPPPAPAAEAKSTPVKSETAVSAVSENRLARAEASKALPANRHVPRQAPLPREVFLPAIDTCRERRRSRRKKSSEHSGCNERNTPLSEMAAAGENAAECTVRETPSPRRPERTADARPADRLPSLRWPAPFRSLRACFDQCPPLRLMDWPGWRFVQLQGGENALWIGCQRSGDRICRIAYVLPAGAAAPAGKPFRPALNAAGDAVQVLVLKA